MTDSITSSLSAWGDMRKNEFLEPNRLSQRIDSETFDEVYDPSSMSILVHNNDSGNETSSLDSVKDEGPPTVSKLASTFEKGLSKKEIGTEKKTIVELEEASPKPRTALTRYQTHLSQLKLVPDTKSPPPKATLLPEPEQSPMESVPTFITNDLDLEPAQPSDQPSQPARPEVAHAAVGTDTDFLETSAEDYEQVEEYVPSPLQDEKQQNQQEEQAETSAAAQTPVNVNLHASGALGMPFAGNLTGVLPMQPGGLENTASSLLMTAALNALTQAHASSDSRDPLTSALAAASAQILAAALQSAQQAQQAQAVQVSPVPGPHLSRMSSQHWDAYYSSNGNCSQQGYYPASASPMRHSPVRHFSSSALVERGPPTPSAAPAYRGNGSKSPMNRGNGLSIPPPIDTAAPSAEVPTHAAVPAPTWSPPAQAPMQATPTPASTASAGSSPPPSSPAVSVLTATPTTPAETGGNFVFSSTDTLPISALSRPRSLSRPTGGDADLKSSLSHSTSNAAGAKNPLVRTKSLTFSDPPESVPFSPPTYKDYHAKYANGLNAVAATRNAHSASPDNAGVAAGIAASDGGAYLYTERSFDYSEFGDLRSEDGGGSRKSGIGELPKNGSPTKSSLGGASLADASLPGLNKTPSRLMMDVLLEGTDVVTHRLKNEASYKPPTKHYTKLFHGCDPRVFEVEIEGAKSASVSPLPAAPKSPNLDPYRNSIMHLITASPQVIKPRPMAADDSAISEGGFGEETKSDSENDFGGDVIAEEHEDGFGDFGTDTTRPHRAPSDNSCTPMKSKKTASSDSQDDVLSATQGEERIASAFDKEDVISSFDRTASENSMNLNKGSPAPVEYASISGKFGANKSTKSMNDSNTRAYGNTSVKATRGVHKSFKYDPSNSKDFYGFQTRSIKGQAKLHDTALDFVQEQCLNSVDAKNLKLSSVRNRNVLVGWQILILKKGELSLLGLAVITGVRTNMFMQTEYRISTDVTLDCWVRLKRQKGYGGTEFQPLRKVLTTKQCATRLKIISYKK